MFFSLTKRLLCQFSVSKFNSSKDYYKVLGISNSANEKQIKKSFRQLAKKFHPDSSTGNQQKFKQVNEAYQVLSDQSTKRQYDQTRSYSNSNSSYSQNYNPNQQQQGGYQNYSNGQYNYNQQYHQAYQRPGQNSTYRGYTRSDGWQNQKYREEVMNDIFKEYQKEYQRQTMGRAQQNRQNYGSFENIYTNHAEHIRQYTESMKVRQEAIRKAYEQQQERRERQYREYQQKQMRDLKQFAEKKVNDMKDGFVKNVYGFIKVGEFLKDTWKNIKGGDDKKKK